MDSTFFVISSKLFKISLVFLSFFCVLSAELLFELLHLYIVTLTLSFHSSALLMVQWMVESAEAQMYLVPHVV